MSLYIHGHRLKLALSSAGQYYCIFLVHSLSSPAWRSLNFSFCKTPSFLFTVIWFFSSHNLLFLSFVSSILLVTVAKPWSHPWFLSLSTSSIKLWQTPLLPPSTCLQTPVSSLCLSPSTCTWIPAAPPNGSNSSLQPCLPTPSLFLAHWAEWSS